MPQLAYRYTVSESVPTEEVEVTILLAMIAIESLHGEVEARLDVAHNYDADRRIVVVDASTPAGRDLSKLLTGFLNTEFGPNSFTVERVEQTQPKTELVTA
jgi:hypothetical protein